ncbi:MAG: phosphate-starvation-inducible PsiE family protein [Deltaproteobacteria bacterium]|nr:phosphate-starvation-inducible PsiE family protein [Deltaproteobacteria bacterium]
MEKFLKKFERFIVIGLLAMMIVVVLLGTVELAVILVEQMVKPPRFILLNINEMLNIFGFFLMILIGLELVETLKVYFVDEMVHVEIVFLVAIIAITRKVIILDVKTMEPLNLIGLACIILALSVGYFVLKKALNLKQ